MARGRTEAVLRRELLHYCHTLHHRGWVANHDGNITVKVSEARLVCTPTGMSKGDVTVDDLVVLDGQGNKTAGKRRSFSELVLHLEVFQRRPDVGAVIHAHCPHATAWGLVNKAFPHPFLPEAVVSLGATIPSVPLTMPGAEARAALSPWVRKCDAVIIRGNGVLTWGPDIETAYLRMELVEHLATIATSAEAVGGIERLPVQMVQTLLAKRAKGGLMAPEENSQSFDVVQASAKRVSASLPLVPQAKVEDMTARVMASMGIKGTQ